MTISIDSSKPSAAGSGGWNTIGYWGYVMNPEVPTTGGGGGLYTVRFRHYDAELGRWLERDPLGYVDGMNLYGYAMGSPIRFSDPIGLHSDSGSKTHGQGRLGNCVWRVDSEINPNDGNIHIQHGPDKNKLDKYFFNPNDGKLYDKSTGKAVSKRLQKNLLGDRNIQRAIGRH